MATNIHDENASDVKRKNVRFPNRRENQMHGDSTRAGQEIRICSIKWLRMCHSDGYSLWGVCSSHESSSSRESSSSHESGSSQVPNFFFLFFFFDYTNDVRAVTRNINFPVGDIFHSRSKEPLLNLTRDSNLTRATSKLVCGSDVAIHSRGLI